MAKKTGEKEVLKKFSYKEFKDIPTVERENFSVFDIEEDMKILENKELKSKRCGSVDNFEKYLSVYEKTKSSFTVVSYGSTKKIIYGKNTFLFTGIKGEKKPQGMHLIGMVKRDINNLISSSYNEEKDEYEIWDNIPKIPNKKPHLTQINYKNCQWYGTGTQMLAIDINHCYWRTAFMLGYIKEETYLKGIEKDEYKKGRLIAIGTLGKMLTVKKYENGVKIKEYIDDRDYLKYGRFFWHIISKIYELIQELKIVLGEDFLMFLTDCIFIDQNKKDIAIEIMNKHGYSTKDYLAVFTNTDNNTLNWITEKGEEKQMVVVDYKK